MIVKKPADVGKYLKRWRSSPRPNWTWIRSGLQMRNKYGECRQVLWPWLGQLLYIWRAGNQSGVTPSLHELHKNAIKNMHNMPKFWILWVSSSRSGYNLAFYLTLHGWYVTLDHSGSWPFICDRICKKGPYLAFRNPRASKMRISAMVYAIWV